MTFRCWSSRRRFGRNLEQSGLSRLRATKKKWRPSVFSCTFGILACSSAPRSRERACSGRGLRCFGPSDCRGVPAGGPSLDRRLLGPAGSDLGRDFTVDQLHRGRHVAAAADALHDFMSRLPPEKVGMVSEGGVETANALTWIDPLVQMLLNGPEQETGAPDAQSVSYFN